MIKYRLKEPLPFSPFPNFDAAEMFVILRAASIDARSKLEFEGDAGLIDTVVPNLMLVSGADGHGMEEWTTPRDLARALRQPLMRQFEAELIEGHSIVEAS
jgi:hypothetical protein